MTDEARKRLERERGELQELRNAMAEGEELDESQRASVSTLAAGDNHPADVATEAFERAKNLSIFQQFEDRLADVDRALEQVDAGTYGTCEACGRSIPAERLGAIPTARYCVDDQARLERSPGG